MTLRFLSFFFGLIFFGIVAVGKAQEQQSHFLWKLTEGKKTAYIMGIFPGASMDFKSDLTGQDAFKNMTGLLLKAHPDSVNYQYQRLYTERGFYENDDHLKHHLPKKLYESLDQYLEELGFPLGHQPRMKPWLITLSLQNLELKQAGLDPEGTISDIWGLAKAQQWKIHTLESFSKTQAAFAHLPEMEHVQYLEHVLQTSRTRIKTLQMLTSDRDQNRAKRLKSFYTKEIKKLPRSVRQIQNDQQKEWVSKLKSLLDEGEIPLLIVDLQELYGSNNLFDILKQSGFKIESL